MLWSGIAILSALVLLLGLTLWRRWHDRPSVSPERLPLTTRPDPRQRTDVSGGGCGLIFGLFWTAFSVIFVVFPLGLLAMEWQTYSLLRETGVPAEGVVTSRRLDRDDDGDSYYVTYEYSAPLPQGDRGRYVNEESVGFNTYQQLPPETRATIHYSATDPSISRLGESSTGLPVQVVFLTCFSLFGTLFVLIGLSMVTQSLRSIAWTRALSRRGQTTTAILTERWIEKDSDGDSQYCVAYRFTVPGWPEVLQAEFNRQVYQTMDHAGTAPVRYLPERPEVCRLLVK